MENQNVELKEHQAGWCLCVRAWADFDLALGFCGVPSTRTVGPFTCAWVVELLAASDASSLTGAGASSVFVPSLWRRPLNAFDMLTSRCKTLRGLDSVRRIPASCSREIERERERDCAALRVELALFGFA